jgi:phosphatidylinositol-3-phosphatase
MKTLTLLTFGIVVSVLAVACGKSNSPTTPTPTPSGPINHVFMVVEENQAADAVIGSPQMPYLNSLATQYALATQYYANTHPSIGNYFMLTVGSVVTNDSFTSTIVTDDNIVRQLLAAGKTWKSYSEDLPSVGYTGGDTGGYARRHNVLALLSDVVNNPGQVGNLVPFSQFSNDLAGNAFPSYSFIEPNLCNGGHDCPLNIVDGWLQAHIGPLINSAQFQSWRGEVAESRGLPSAREPDAGTNPPTSISTKARCD